MQGNVSPAAISRKLAEEHPTGQFLVNMTSHRLAQWFSVFQLFLVIETHCVSPLPARR